MAIIVGLEGVLALHGWRHGLIESEGWDAYHAASSQDAANGPIIQILNAMHRQGQRIYCVSTRPEKWRMLTNQWMVNRGAMVDVLLMRGEGDWRKDEALREEALQGIVAQSGDVLFAIEENEKACDFYRAAGVPVLQLFNPNGAT
jgi:hypothetical protein